MGLYNSQTQASSMETKLIFAMASMAIVSMAAAFPYPYPQAPGPAGLAYPKAGPNGHYDAKHYFQYTNVAAPDVFEWGYRRGNDPQHFREEYLSQKHITSKPNCVGEMLMRVKENNSTITTMELMPHPTKHLSTVHPSKCQPTQLNYVVSYYLPTQYHRTNSSNKFSNSNWSCA